MRCENCGTNLPEDAVFCPECGGRGRSRSAKEMIDLSHTTGLVRGREAGEVPSVPDPSEPPDAVPDIPQPSPLPDAPDTAIPTGRAAATDATALSGVDRARLREEARRAAQALAETAQDKLSEELAEIAEKEKLIEERGYEVEEVYPSEAPPPPPTSTEERMWEDTQERARLHGVGMPWGEETEAGRDEGAERIGEKIEAAAEEDGGKCCAWGCVTLFVLIFLFFILSFILNVVQ
ncbi:MAG: zinc-ribbon domain-containing protein [Armatimonadota bacterium]